MRSISNGDSGDFFEKVVASHVGGCYIDYLRFPIYDLLFGLADEKWCMVFARSRASFELEFVRENF